ncbi:hypothetical protein D5086_016028 [Populus alba]|uniref:Uncharacterized protein n=1 Tax=Populus alba TaxID=43335 RepID=A0ACC4BTH7_POPAL
MQGGSVNDMWVQGGTDPDAYATRHWYLIDVFVYFSHSLVTLSPPCWTNTAHRRGVKKWDEGRLVRNKLLATMKSAPMNAERLAELAVDLGFDGWLINMEVSLHKQQIPNLEEFVSHLTHAMHSLMPESLVIWYDSVITTGYIWWARMLFTLILDCCIVVDVLKKANVSAAIFAPGCLYETKQPPDFQTARN